MSKQSSKKSELQKLRKVARKARKDTGLGLEEAVRKLKQL